MIVEHTNVELINLLTLHLYFITICYFNEEIENKNFRQEWKEKETRTALQKTYN
jgi:hypothetical protein